MIMFLPLPVLDQKGTPTVLIVDMAHSEFRLYYRLEWRIYLDRPQDCRSMAEVVTFGETMVLMNPRGQGPLRHADEFRKRQGGAESNVAIGLARLGRDVTWFSRLGADPHGRYVECYIRGEGVDTDAVIRDSDAPTGVMFKERRSAGNERVFYYRDGSAASRLGPGDLPRGLIEEASYLHVTGITPALSQSCHEAIFEAIDVAKAAGVRVSVDPNLRLKLWPDEVTMVETMKALISSADLVFPSVEEAEEILDVGEPSDLANAFLDLGPDIAVLKLGEDGAFVAGSDVSEHVPAFDVEPVDEIGAGDGFVAGFIAARLAGQDIVTSARQGNAVGALTTTVPGDVEGLPTREELAAFDGEREAIMR